jgi:hypothetical protein
MSQGDGHDAVARYLTGAACGGVAYWIHEPFFALVDRGAIPKRWGTAFREILQLRNKSRHAR